MVYNLLFKKSLGRSTVPHTLEYMPILTYQYLGRNFPCGCFSYNCLMNISSSEVAGTDLYWREAYLLCNVKPCCWRQDDGLGGLLVLSSPVFLAIEDRPHP